MTLINAGTHFAGGTVLHWGDDPEGRGALFSGDIFMVVMDRRWVSFIRYLRGYSAVQGGEESDSCGAGQRAAIRRRGGS
ncbi:hypothetical protein [Streptomyces sp. MMG1533]|uniref:hypothetical protein n=1 Tax=Streptomyces sp. MMG1533 TaxID=1415546 RepID=UPI0006AEBEF7|nr:hypothetical protein [Streptomyces sp. MMG1533]